MRPSIAAILHRVKAVVSRQRIYGALESPAPGVAVSSTLLISGWSYSPDRRIVRIDARIGPHELPAPAYGLERPDVARLFPRSPHARQCGFHGRVVVDRALAGEQTLHLLVSDDGGQSRTFERTVRIVPRAESSGRSPEDRIRRAVHAASDSSFAALSLPSVSIIIPVHGGASDTDACLRQLQATLPQDIPVEIIVVDDASADQTPAVLKRWTRTDSRIRAIANDVNCGFGASCNRGAQAARHDVLVFLNNDTLPQSGWLRPLLAPFRDSTVGAVGARLLYPDGSLQEAGGVVFSDGSAWNFGRGSADPDDPLFAYVREVDYCSAAALATPRARFLEVGGFDARFAPAYYEDTDYCFSLHARGLKVLYQPASVVIHIEGATAGTDEAVGPKRAQSINRIAFAAKWRDALRAQPTPTAVDRAALYRHVVRDPCARRVLVCSPTLPEWDRESGSRRVFDLITFLRERGCAVRFLTDSVQGGDRYVAALQQMGVAVHVDAVAELLALGRFDLALLHFWWIGERMIPLIREASPSTRIAVDSVDLHFLRRSRNPRAAAADADAAEKQRELSVYSRADAVLAVSGSEAETIGELTARPAHVRVVPDAESFAPSTIPFDERRGLLFLGNFRHHPNVDALEYLMRAIVPLLPPALLARHPISVVGTDLTDAVIDRCAARHDGVRLVGWVPQVQPYIEHARVMVAPLTYGAGTKRKLIQSAMIGTPAVSTSIGVEGLPLRDHAHVLVADSAAAFAAAIDRLVADRELWERLATAGREAIRATHDREVVRRQFNVVIDDLLA